MSVRILILLLVAGTSVGCQSTGSTRADDSTTVICTTDDDRSRRIEAFLDGYQAEDLSKASDLFAEGVEFFWGTPEEPFDIDGWREAMRAQHDQFDDIEMADRMITTGTYPDGMTWTTVWCIWRGTNVANGERPEYLLHLSYKWSGDEIVAEYGFFDAGRFAEEFEQG